MAERKALSSELKLKALKRLEHSYKEVNVHQKTGCLVQQFIASNFKEKNVNHNIVVTLQENNDHEAWQFGSSSNEVVLEAAQFQHNKWTPHKQNNDWMKSTKCVPSYFI